MGGEQAAGVLAQIQSEKKIREGKQVNRNRVLIVRRVYVWRNSI